MILTYPDSIRPSNVGAAVAVQVPLNVMEDRLLGSVDVEESVKQVPLVRVTWAIIDSSHSQIL